MSGRIGSSASGRGAVAGAGKVGTSFAGPPNAWSVVSFLAHTLPLVAIDVAAQLSGVDSSYLGQGLVGRSRGMA
jgi:hypothetical protein